MSLKKKYPYLTAWLKYTIITFGISFTVGAILRSFNYGIVLWLFLLPFISYLVFETVIWKNILDDSGENISKTDGNFSERHPFFVAWIGFTIISVLINNIIRFPSQQLFPDSTLMAIIQLGLWTFINFFVFKFFVKKYIVDQFSLAAALELEAINE